MENQASDYKIPGVEIHLCFDCGREMDCTENDCPRCGAPLTLVQRNDLVGALLGDRYEISSVLATGGMGVVYRARHTWLERDVAVKVLRSDLTRDPVRVRRFLREARSASTLRSPHTVTIHDFGTTADGAMYYAMELLHGQNLADRITRHGPLPWREAANVAVQVCASLEEAHHAGIWHRDIKPDNIFLLADAGTEPFVKILDFGIAKVAAAEKKITGTGILCGTAHYLSPEQAAAHNVDHRTDLYSLGCVLYEMLTGHPPFDAGSLVRTVLCHVHDPVPPLRPADESTPERLVQVVNRCLEKNPDDRPQSARELRESLQNARDHADDTRPTGTQTHQPHRPTTPLFHTPVDDPEVLSRTPTRSWPDPSADTAADSIPLPTPTPTVGRLRLASTFLIAAAAGLGLGLLVAALTGF